MSMRKTWWAEGLYNAICDICGAKRKSDELVERWDGFHVCAPRINDSACFEHRHPQDFIKTVPDTQKLPWTRPESQDIFVQQGYCTADGRQGVSDFGTADCAMADIDLGLRPDITNGQVN